MNVTTDDMASSLEVVVNNLTFGVFNIVLSIATICLNFTTIFAYIKSKVLKDKLAYLMIMMLSVNDFLVGLVSNVLFAVVLLEQYSSRKIAPHLSTIHFCFLVFFSGCSLKTLVVMSWERYAAICHPLFHRTKVTRKRLMKCVILLWLAALISTILSKRFQAFFEYYIIPERLVFIILLMYFYVRIYLANLYSSKNIRSKNRINQGSDLALWNGRRRKVMMNVNLAKSCFLAVISFVICYLPSTIAMMIKEKCGKEMQIMVEVWATTLILLNSSLNSIVFFWRSKPLRKEVFAVISSIFRKKERGEVDAGSKNSTNVCTSAS
ncbi:olfactory receptor 4M1-like isoform X2 [Dendronephthya gigantea]|nr:olfactory receptor 4M1-like isoform X2 [Dendronephthya gigantea]